MVGGSTRVPLVKESVSKFFGRKVNDALNPDEVVALVQLCRQIFLQEIIKIFYCWILHRFHWVLKQWAD